MMDDDIIHFWISEFECSLLPCCANVHALHVDLRYPSECGHIIDQYGGGGAALSCYAHSFRVVDSEFLENCFHDFTHFE